MKESELLYHYPYKVDKENNFRHFIKELYSFERTNFYPYDPQIDGNLFEYIETRKDLTKTEKYKILYLSAEYQKWGWWFKYGQNIFSFSKELLILLDHTDISKVKARDFKLPYDIFYLSLKPLKIKLQPDREEIIDGVYVETNIYDPSGVHRDGYFEIHLQFVGEFENFFIELCETKEKDGFQMGEFWNVFFEFSKEEGIITMDEAINKAIQWTEDEVFQKSDIRKSISDSSLDYYNDHIKLIDKTLKLVINCLLYLSQPKEKIDNEKKLPNNLPSNFDKKLSFAKTQKDKDVIIKKVNEFGFSKINFIGNSFRKNTSSNLKGAKTNSHWRRGHWRNQKFGKNLTKLKLIWILPTIVNKSEELPIKGHLYTTENE